MVIIVSAQSPSQLRTKWSVPEAETMFNAATIKVVFGGLSVDNDLEWLARLTGRRYVLNHTRQTRPDWRTDYSSHWEEVSVLRPDEIRTLSPGHALVMISATAPIIADLPLVFDTRGGRQLLADMNAMAARNDRARMPTVPV
jgi:type IV secretion system protein VirD4